MAAIIEQMKSYAANDAGSAANGIWAWQKIAITAIVTLPQSLAFDICKKNNTSNKTFA